VSNRNYTIGSSSVKHTLAVWVSLNLTDAGDLHTMIEFSEWVWCICWSSCQQFYESDEWYCIRCFMCSTPYIFPMGDL